MKVQVENAQQNEQVDWSKNPQLVVSIMTQQIYIYTHESDDSRFNGIEIKTFSNYLRLAKENFKPFHGKITLQND